MSTTSTIDNGELERAVAERVMGYCVHEWEETPREVRVYEERQAFREEYGEDPPEGYTGNLESDEWLGVWDLTCTKCGERRRGGPHGLPPRSGHTAHYARDISCAWSVIDRLHKLGFYVSISDQRHGKYRFKPKSKWKGWMISVTRATDKDDHPTHLFRLFDKSLPRLICRAALEAIDTDMDLDASEGA